MLRYSYDGTIKLSAKMIVWKNDIALQLKVKDQGVGISDMNNIGKMFSILSIKDKVNQSGIGFGLTISSMIVEKLGGVFEIKNNYDVSNQIRLFDRSGSSETPRRKNGRDLSFEQGLTVKIILPSKQRLQRRESYFTNQYSGHLTIRNQSH